MRKDNDFFELVTRCIYYYIKELIHVLPYVPKKSREIYKETIAHRGYHLHAPENSIAAYKEALNKNYAIEFDIRLTKDNHIVCLHDRHTKRLLGISGKTSQKTYEELKKYCILESRECIPTLSQVLELVDGKITILIEVKGLFTDRFRQKLLEDLRGYKGRVYFHAKNIITYYRLQNIWKDRVFWVLNPFRKRFYFIKNRQYKRLKRLTMEKA